MDKLASAFLLNGQMQEGEDMVLRLFETRGKVSIGVLHNHLANLCAGDLIISREGLSYQVKKGDVDHAFTVKAADIIGVSQGVLKRDSVAIPSLIVEYRDAKGKEKKYDFVTPAYLKNEARKQNTFGGSGIANLYTADTQGLEDTAKIHRMVMRLIQDKVK